MLRFDLLSLFPEYFTGPLDESILKRAQQKGLVEIQRHNIRDFAQGKHRKVDDKPYGGGPGMVMMPGPIVEAIRHVRARDSHVIYLSPQGRLLTSAKCKQLALHKHLVLVCGHYEGIDQRVIDSHIDEEISIGDYVLTNGCLASVVLIDAIVRFIPGVLRPASVCNDSFEAGIFDYPCYTHPVVYEGEPVPQVLLTGDHAKIDAWRETQALKKTAACRPDLYAKRQVSISTTQYSF